MALYVQKVNTGSKALRRIKEIYIDSFPDNERCPMALLLLFCIRKCVDFYAVYDGPQLCGFTYLVKTAGLVFVMYLATDERVRSQGYGSKILNWIKSEHHGDEIVLNIEPVIPDTDNYEQRLRRQKFYFKNGFYDTGYRIMDSKGSYDILSTNPRFSPDKYKRLLEKFSFRIKKLKLSKK